MADPSAADWDHAGPDILPAADEVVIWRQPFRRPPAEVDYAANLLTPEERARASRLVRPLDREAFVLQRASLRLILQRMLEVPAGRIQFALGERGKPAVAGVGGAPEFNVSGSGDWGLLAFARKFAVGVDLEAHRDLDHLDLAGRVFAPEEQAQLAALRPEERAAGFFAGWSRKEAFIKALGLGLYFPLDRFAVELRPGEPARVLSVHGNPALGREWTLADVTVAPRYSAAVAAQASFSRIRRYEVPDLRTFALD